jgi:hypothetical protein
MTARRLLRSAACVALALLLGACATRMASAPPPPPPQNYFAPDEQGPSMRRVALLPLYNDAYPDRYLGDLDATFTSELTKRAIFEVVPVSRSQMESLFGERHFCSTTPLPAGAMAKLRDHFGVDGVLFTDLTHFSPYRPVSMGVRTKLVDVVSQDIRWAFDYVFDSGNSSVAEAAKRYQIQYSNEHRPLSTDGGSILLSPTRFAKFVANQTYGSLH